MSNRDKQAELTDKERMAQYQAELDKLVEKHSELKAVIDKVEEEKLAQLKSLNKWVESQGLPKGQLLNWFADTEESDKDEAEPDNAEQADVEPNEGKQDDDELKDVDLIWKDGFGAVFDKPVVVLLYRQACLAMAQESGLLCFTSVDDFKQFVQEKIKNSAEV
jgi:hypothetical protein